MKKFFSFRSMVFPILVAFNLTNVPTIAAPDYGFIARVLEQTKNDCGVHTEIENFADAYGCRAGLYRDALVEHIAGNGADVSKESMAFLFDMIARLGRIYANQDIDTAKGCFVLDSCACKEAPLSLRKHAALLIVSRVLERYQQGNPISYASVGSGFLFQDYAILKMIRDYLPGVPVYVHLIDPHFDSTHKDYNRAQKSLSLFRSKLTADNRSQVHIKTYSSWDGYCKDVRAVDASQRVNAANVLVGFDFGSNFVDASIDKPSNLTGMTFCANNNGSKTVVAKILASMADVRVSRGIITSTVDSLENRFIKALFEDTKPPNNISADVEKLGYVAPAIEVCAAGFQWLRAARSKLPQCDREKVAVQFVDVPLCGFKNVALMATVEQGLTCILVDNGAITEYSPPAGIRLQYPVECAFMKLEKLR